MDYIELSVNNLFRIKNIIKGTKSEFSNRIDELIDKCMSSEEDNFDKVKIFQNDLVYNYLVELITNLDILSMAKAIARYEKNITMFKSINEYFNKYLNNQREKISNELVTSELLADNQVISYILRYNSVEEFAKVLKPRKSNNINNQFIKGKTRID